VLVPNSRFSRGPAPPRAALKSRPLPPRLRATLRCGGVTDPACLEGGDVLRIGQTLYVGASSRANAATSRTA